MQVMHAAVPHSIASSSVAAKPLHSFPSDSATASVCTHLLESSIPKGTRDASDGKLPEASVASSAAVLARSPWIAAADWEPVLHCNMHALDACDSPAGIVAAARGQIELLNMVLMHGQHARTGLTRWLGQAAESKEAWNVLPTHVRLHAFASLSRIVRNLSPTAQQLLLRCAERALTEQCMETPEATDLHAWLLKCAVARGVMLCVRNHTFSASLVQDSTASRLQDRILQLLRTLLTSCMPPHAWRQGIVRYTPVPSSLPWKLVCASLPQNVLEPSVLNVPEADSAASEASESSIMLLRRACMHDGVAEGSQEEYAESALATWCSTCPVHTLPSTPSCAQVQAWTWACIVAALRSLPASLVSSFAPEMVENSTDKVNADEVKLHHAQVC